MLFLWLSVVRLLRGWGVCSTLIRRTVLILTFNWVLVALAVGPKQWRIGENDCLDGEACSTRKQA